MEWYPGVAAAFQNAVQRYPVTCDEKGTTAQTSLGSLFRRVDRTEFSKEPEPVPSNAIRVRQE